MRWACRTLRATNSSAVVLGVLTLLFQATGTTAGFSQQAAKSLTVASPGDQPSDPGPLASDLSPALRSKQIRAVIKKVADWELARVEAQPPSRTWDFATLDIGLMAASRTLHDGRYSQYVAKVGEHFGWKLERTTVPANDFAMAQAFVDVYRSSHREEQIAPSRRQFDDMLAVLNDPEKPAWGWSDALFMTPPAGVELSDITSDPTYNAYVDREWGKAGKALYDRQKHLFVHDTGELNKREKNGEKFFGARSNGLVMAGTVRVLSDLPSDDPLRPQYIELLREMAAAVAAAQQSDGLWRPGMLDTGSYPLPEVSSSALFTYALAWGINHRMLDSDTYLPVVERAWGGLLTHVYADGRLGCIQPMGDAQAAYTAGASYNYGVGAFLLAGAEVEALSTHKHW
jgi:unsaturated rhamnogalacturonyl hydrolase